MSTFRSRQFKKEDLKKLLQTDPQFEDFLTATNQANKLLEAILNAGLLFSDNVQAFWKTMEWQATTPWVALSPSAPWASFDGGATFEIPSYARDGAGRVFVKGLAKTTGAAASGSTVATLPVGFRPAKQRVFTQFGSNGVTQAAYRAEVTAAGAIVWDSPAGGGANPTWTYAALEFVFDAVSPAPGVNPGFPFSFANTLSGGAKAKSVLLASALDITTPQAPVAVSLSQPAWSMASSGAIQISDVQGVQPNRKYRFLFLVLGG